MKNLFVQGLETNLGPLTSLSGTDPSSLKMSVFDLAIFTIVLVHRCGASGSMCACHAAGPGSIPGRDKFPG